MTLAAGLLTGVLAVPARATVPPLAATPSATSTALAAEAFARGISAKLLAAVAGCILAAGGLAYGLASGSTDEPPIPPPVAVESPSLPVLAPAPRVVETKQWVSFSGRVVFPKDREVPAPRVVPANQIKDLDTWQPFMPLREEDVLVDPPSGGIANVVVFLRPDADDRKAEFPAEKVHPDLVNAKLADRIVFATAGQFSPRVIVARAGDRVTFRNLLPVPTNVHYTATLADSVTRDFNVLIVKEMSHTSKPLPATRGPDAFHSSIYRWMKGYVWAFDHPYFSVTDATGRFVMPLAPTGTWRLVVWHESAGYRDGWSGMKITIPETRDGAHELDPLVFDILK